MKSQSAGIFLFFLTATAFAGRHQSPQHHSASPKIERREGVFKIRPEKRILGLHGAFRDNKSSRTPLRWKPVGICRPTSQIHRVPTSGRLNGEARDTIGQHYFDHGKFQDDLGAEGYELSVASDSVIIRASDEAGVFYGVQSLLQLLPPEIFAMKPIQGIAWNLPCVRIEDHRGFNGAV